MVIIGAKGFAKEVLEILFQLRALDNLYFFDDLSTDLPPRLYGRFEILRSLSEVKRLFGSSGDNRFTLGLGNPSLRYSLCQVFEEAGGVLTSVISPKSDVGNFGTSIGPGCNILSGSVITNGVTMGRGCLVNPGCSISHDSTVGDFSEIGPGVRITGHCRIGSFAVLGTNAVILPKVNVGSNVVVGAGAVVRRDVPDNTLVAGVPAVVKRRLPPLELQA